MDPPLIAIAVEPDPAPFVPAFEDTTSLPQDQLGDLFAPERGLGGDWGGAGPSDDGGGGGHVPGGVAPEPSPSGWVAAQARQRTTPRKVQTRQTKVPQPWQG
jgi:hypothetical protein